MRKNPPSFLKMQQTGTFRNADGTENEFNI